MVTLKAFEEFEKLVPDKIDRHDLKKFPIGYATKDSLLGVESHENWKLRRSSMLKLMGFNAISDYFSIVVKSCHDVVSEMKVNEPTDFTLHAKKLSFRAISQILFGKDIKSMNLTIDHYSVETGKANKCELEDMMLKFVRDVGTIIASPIDKIFPLIKTYPICQPYKSLKKNCDNIYEIVKEVCEASNDGSSIYKKALALGTIDKKEVVNDIVGLLFAGTDTTADSISSCLYFLNKNQHVYQKLMKEMKLYGLDELKNKDLSDDQLKDIYNRLQECDYLTYVVKEGLRIDTPAQFSIKYNAYLILNGIFYVNINQLIRYGSRILSLNVTSFQLELSKDPERSNSYRCQDFGEIPEVSSFYHKQYNIQICGVPIKKGSVLAYGNYGPLYSPEQWHKPTEFIPERFDPSSEYFNKPDGSNKPRHPKAWVPFSNGIRTCPGKVLAIFEIKATIATLLHLIDYEIDKNLLANDTARFNMQTQYHALGKVNKIY